MPLVNHQSEQDFEATSSRLSDDLRSCRAVVSNYRALLAGDGEDVDGQAGFAGNGEAAEERRQ